MSATSRCAARVLALGSTHSADCERHGCTLLTRQLPAFQLTRRMLCAGDLRGCSHAHRQAHAAMPVRPAHSSVQLVFPHPEKVLHKC